MTLIQSLPAVSSVVYKAIRQDRQNRYGLIFAVAYGIVRTTRFPAFDFDNGILQFVKKSEDSFEMLIKPFPPESNLWDGTSNLPDTGTKDLDALFRASLGHDVLYSFAEELAKAGETATENIMAFADDFLKIVADANGCSSKFSKAVYHIVRNLGMLYHRIMKVLTLVAISLCPACVFENPTDFTSIQFPNPPLTWEINGKTNSWNTVESTTNAVETPPQENYPIIQETVEVPTISHEEPSTLSWVYGGFNASKASVIASPISDIKVKGDTISFKWSGKVPSSWARRSTEKGNLLVFCVFLRQGSNWVGGKIDWVDEHRTTRSIENIRAGYNGWKAAEWDKASEIGILVASSDGKNRSELVTCKK